MYSDVEMKWVRGENPRLIVKNDPTYDGTDREIPLESFNFNELHTLFLCKGFHRKEGSSTENPQLDDNPNCA